MAGKLALVMSGGGARGALEVGAVQALIEAGYKPDILVGTSIGAVNAVCLALNGVDEQGLKKLKDIFRQSAEIQILPRDYLRLALRALARRPVTEPSRRIRELFIANGITPELCFGDIKGVRLLLVATDLNHFARVIYGLKPDESILDAAMASVALPPWVAPIEKNGMLLVDGGVVSNLPLEPALSAKPREIIALDVQEWRDIPEDANGFGPLFNKLFNTVQKRQFDLEFLVATAARVPVRYIHLYADQPVPLYAFERWEELIERGYEQTQQAIRQWPVKRKRWWSFS
jgi:NTE family protein